MKGFQVIDKASIGGHYVQIILNEDGDYLVQINHITIREFFGSDFAQDIFNRICGALKAGTLS